MPIELFFIILWIVCAMGNWILSEADPMVATMCCPLAYIIGRKGVYIWITVFAPIAFCSYFILYLHGTVSDWLASRQ